MRRLPLIVTVALLFASAATAQATRPFDALRDAYAPYLAADEPAGWPMKVRSLTEGNYKFWRGSKDLFFAWSKVECADWYAQPAAYVASHGDVHLGNVGTYAAAGGWHNVRFGLVDFDESARLPFEVDLLQSLVTLRLVAAENGIDVSDDEWRAVSGAVLSDYTTAFAGGEPAGALLADIKPVAKLLKKATNGDYAAEVEELTDGGKFRPTVFNAKGKLKDLLTPLDAKESAALVDALAAALADPNQAALRARFRPHSRRELTAALKDAARRTRIGSSGSQGLGKYFLLLDRPLVDYDGDVVIYLKQEIPSAAERQAAAARDARSPGRRYAETAALLTDPPPYLNGWCDAADGHSFWVSFKEPWGDELDAAGVKDADELKQMAHVLAVAVGAAHARANTLAPTTVSGGETQLTAALLAEQLAARSAAYAVKVRADFTDFSNDPRTADLVKRAESALPPSQ